MNRPAWLTWSALRPYTWHSPLQWTLDSVVAVGMHFGLLVGLCLASLHELQRYTDTEGNGATDHLALALGSLALLWHASRRPTRLVRVTRCTHGGRPASEARP